MAFVRVIIGNLLAATSVLSPSAVDKLTAGQLQAYSRIQQVAVDSCLTPSLTGWSVAGAGQVKVALNLPAFLKFLAGKGVTLQAGLKGEYWSGLLQKDAAQAFSNRNDCVRALSIAMIARLPAKDAKTGKLLPKPAHPETVYRTIMRENTTQTTNTTEQQQSNVGNVNGSGVQVNNTGAANTYLGPVATGGGNAYLTLTPPVTADEKQQAHDRLIAELTQLSTYPDRETKLELSTILEGHMALRYPISLYATLDHYYDSTIMSVPSGQELLQFRRGYYSWRIHQRKLENDAILWLGATVTTRQRAAWSELYRYCMLRTAGLTAATIKAAWGDIGWTSFDEAEKTFALFASNTEITGSLQSSQRTEAELMNAAGNLLNRYRPTDAPSYEAGN